MAGPGQGQNHTQPPSTASQSRKGTFTDDLHKLVDNWARDAMNLSQVKRGSKPQQQTPSQGHSYEVTPQRGVILIHIQEINTAGAVVLLQYIKSELN